MAPTTPDSHRPRILVVEDTLLIADLLADQLRDEGFDVVGPVPRVAQALALATAERLDGALLDINLAGEECFPIASALSARGIPFAFLTGYADSIMPPSFRDMPRLTKPFKLGDLASLLEHHFRGRGS